MKKITLLSIATATMLLTGCNNSTVKDATAKASEAASSATETAKDKASDLAQAAKDKAADAVEAAKKKAEEAAAAAKEKAAQMAEEAKAKAAEAVEAAKEKATEAVEAVKESETVKAATETVSNAVETAKEKASEAVEATKAKAAEATEAVKEKMAPASQERMPENPDVTAPDTKEAAPAAAVDSAKGKALYAKCAGCHGANGQTKALGKSDVIAGMDAATVAEDLKGYKAGTLNKHSMGALMKGQAAGLSDEDITALSAYISALK